MMTMMKIGREEGQLPGGNIEVRMTMKREIIQEEIISEAKTIGIEADKTRDLLAELTKKGDVYTPKHRFYKPT